MSPEDEKLLSEFIRNPGASAEALSPFEGFLPNDYLAFLRRSNGGEGFVGEGYLVLWRAEEILPFNKDYQAEQYVPELLLFGSNGGGEAFAFDKRERPMPIVMVPFIGMELKCAISTGRTFSEFLHRLAQGKLFNV